MDRAVPTYLKISLFLTTFLSTFLSIKRPENHNVMEMFALSVRYNTVVKCVHLDGLGVFHYNIYQILKQDVEIESLRTLSHKDFIYAQQLHGLENQYLLQDLFF